MDQQQNGQRQKGHNKTSHAKVVTPKRRASILLYGWEGRAHDDYNTVYSVT